MASAEELRVIASPFDVTERVAANIAEPLRDAGYLKPANVKVRPDGTVKVLDFGLAKTLDPSADAGSGVLDDATITSPAHLRQGYGAQAHLRQGHGGQAEKPRMWMRIPPRVLWLEPTTDGARADVIRSEDAHRESMVLVVNFFDYLRRKLGSS
jgi:hypothetical protein